MADQPPRPEETPQAAGWAAHDWYAYDSYLNVHHSFMEQLLREGNVMSSRLSFREFSDGRTLREVNIKGVVACAEQVSLYVDKWLAARRNRRGQVEVKGQDYVYHARLRSGRRNLFRYCSAHGLDDLHCHRFDLRTGQEVGRPNIQLQELPSLSDVILEAIALARHARQSAL